jgi:hypothetical protein
MAFTHRIAKTWTSGAGGRVSATVTSTADAEDNRTLIIETAVTNQAVTLSILADELKSIYMVSTQTVTVKTNQTGPEPLPDDTLTLTAGIPLTWTNQDGAANPFSEDVSVLYVTNTSGETATIQIRVLQDSTPA